jgi:ACT domain-containing protein
MNINTEEVLKSVNSIRRAITQINKARSTWKKYQKTAKERNFTDEQIRSAQQVLRESVAGSLAVVIEASMLVSQMDEVDIEPMSELHADEIIVRN